MENLVVTVKQGSLRGAKVKTFDGYEYICFSEIPYAAPPTGELRFKDPQPVKPWSGTLDYSPKNKISLQFDLFTNQIQGTEDCLYLNICTTSLTERRAVMVWIHGGGFNAGSGGRQFCGPDYLIKHDIVFVSINYRLGVLGFLNMDLEDCPGNQGLKDQAAALRWVRENISAFGGDPNNVTIFGESAGGASVHALCISPLAKGLFDKAIAQSGSMYNTWAYRRSNKQYGFEMAKAFGKNTTNVREAVDFLRTIPEKQLVEMQHKLYPMTMENILIFFNPTWDNKSSQPFFPQDITKVKQKVEVPFLFGYASHEACMFIDLREGAHKKLDENFTNSFSYWMHMDVSPELSNIATKVRKYYFRDRSITPEENNIIVQCQSDIMFVNGIQYLSDIQMNNSSQTYFYRFSFLPAVSFSSILRQTCVQGCSHGDELCILLYPEILGEKIRIKPNTKDELVMKRLTRMWTDFAKTGNPTPRVDDLIPVKWPQFSKGSKHYLEINDELCVGVNPGKTVWEFWKPIIEQLFSK